MNFDDLRQWQKKRLSEDEFRNLTKEDQNRYLFLLDKLTHLQKTHKILFYEPHPNQMKFHLSKAPIKAIFGGNRSGKTTAGVVEFLMHMTGQYPEWYPEYNRFPREKIVKGRMVARDFQNSVGGVLIPAIEQWIDAEVGGAFIEKRFRNPIGITTKWVFKTGNSFDILTYEQSVEQFEGWSGDIAWFDEPPPRDKYIATRRGLVDTSGRCMLTLTPLKQPWIYDEIYINEDPAYDRVTMTIWDNPYQKTEAIDIFTKGLSEEEKDARLYGKFRHLSGLVYKEFDMDIHVSTIRPQKHWSRFFAMDPHPRTPTACLWVGVDEHDQLYVYDELWLADMTVSEIARAVKAQEADMPARFRYIDPSMDKDNELSGGFNVRKELMKNGIACRRANNDFDYGVSAIRQALRPTYLPLLKLHVPKLRISSNCKHLIYEFQHYLWDDYVMRPEEHTEKQKAKKLHDHFMDCLRYILNANPRYFRQEEEAVEVSYEGTYTKYPTNKLVSRRGSSYYDLTEPR